MATIPTSHEHAAHTTPGLPAIGDTITGRDISTGQLVTGRITRYCNPQLGRRAAFHLDQQIDLGGDEPVEALVRLIDKPARPSTDSDALRAQARQLRNIAAQLDALAHTLDQQ